jgi:hypothetical protein
MHTPTVAETRSDRGRQRRCRTYTSTPGNCSHQQRPGDLDSRPLVPQRGQPERGGRTGCPSRPGMIENSRVITAVPGQGSAGKLAGAHPVLAGRSGPPGGRLLVAPVSFAGRNAAIRSRSRSSRLHRRSDGVTSAVNGSMRWSGRSRRSPGRGAPLCLLDLART